MSRRTVTMDLRLPDDLLVEMREVAKLAGLPVASVMKVALAVEVRRWKRLAPAQEPQS